MASLQDQLLGAGLINKKKAKRIKAEKHQTVKKSRQTNTEVVNKAADQAERARLEQQLKSQQANEQQRFEAEKKAITAQIRQIIELNSVDKGAEGETVVYNFTDADKIKSLSVSQKNHDLITRGNLAIARLDNRYYLIPAEAANKISERDDRSIILLNDALSQESDINEDDPYADYQVPDDLMW